MKLLRPGLCLLMCLNIPLYNRALISARVLNCSHIAVNGNVFLIFFTGAISSVATRNKENVPKAS